MEFKEIIFIALVVLFFIVMMVLDDGLDQDMW